MRRSFALFALALVLLSGRADATTSRQATLGARAIAMAGAFSAVASDASAVHWNPAALATLQRQELGFGYADRFGLGLNQSYLAYSLPIADNHALGVDWFNLGFDDSELGAGQNKLNFAYGYRNGIRALKPYIGSTAIGVAGKYRSLNFDLDGNQLTSAAGWGFDLGLLAPLPFGIRLGLSVQDLGGTSLEHDGGIAEKVYGTRYRLGLAHKPIEGLTVAAGLDDALRFGAEYWVQGLLALRAGLLTELDTPESFGDATTTSFGLGVKYGFATLDYAYERHPVLPATHYTSLSLSYNPRVVAIKDATIRPNPIFRSLYQHYQENDFCDVVIANSAPEPIEVTVGIFLP